VISNVLETTTAQLRASNISDVGPNRRRIIHGDDLLYTFFKDMFERDAKQAIEISRDLLVATAIWLPLDLYEVQPVLLPWVVRDPTCRGSRHRGVDDEWSAPNSEGFMRDDNSAIKGLCRSLPISAPRVTRLNGARMGTEFVASHVWREIASPELASRHPLLNSFIPNLVWLPSQVAKLSDREGSPLQLVLQAMSSKVYRAHVVNPEMRPIVEEAWSLIPQPNMCPEFDVAKLSWFVVTDRFRTLRSTRIREVRDAFATVVAGGSLSRKVVSTRYTAGIGDVSIDACRRMVGLLDRFICDT
jgi:hypothetical protein